ncbi:glyoxylate/hydroxypyruvate reductase B isoform X1 [Latimeria chalumnae]|nr:PREDICTED: glyoxylate/hydroxypyruvate reductase B-like isoform X1 [Latimeria chalumnae]XP_014352989.1 PREDICTED: glyoxylate/hydroxypyruvate reductase B-like isoform X1 [Latimeria chalumnae]|eukprot:XP_006010718.1 PREDICTED: glyoxylate/hydroxypyruvate reductase B-like isoform X1 [Latimeria chalumnae]
MEELPYILISEIEGASGVPEQFAEILSKHFKIVSLEEFTAAEKYFSDKIKAIFMWGCRPEVDQSLLQSLPKLKVIGSSGVGVDHLDLPLISRFGVKVANTPNVVDNATADLGMALLLASARRLIEAVQIAVSPETKCISWNFMGVDVTDATLGIIGMGRIGYKVALRAKGFRLKILYHQRNRRTEEEEKAVGATYCENIEDLLQQSDFVMLVVNLTPQTRNLIGRRQLQLMKPTATLINICRGEVVDHDALVEALQKGEIHAAALDVTYPEPLPRDHPLLTLKNVLVTPHSGTATYTSRLMIAEKMIENLLAGVHGFPLPNEVKPL